MKQLRSSWFVFLLAALMLGIGLPVSARAASPVGLSISTTYPSMVVGIGETVTLNMSIDSPAAQVVNLAVADLPQDWTAEFRGNGRVIESVYVAADSPTAVELRVTPSTPS